MGGRKQQKANLIQRARHRGPGEGTHKDKYASRTRKPQPQEVKPNQPGARPKVLDPVRENEARAAEAVRSLDQQSEEILASLPGGTIEERLRSAKRGLLQDQDAIQSTLTPPKAD